MKFTTKLCYHLKQGSQQENQREERIHFGGEGNHTPHSSQCSQYDNNQKTCKWPISWNHYSLGTLWTDMRWKL